MKTLFSAVRPLVCSLGLLGSFAFAGSAHAWEINFDEPGIINLAGQQIDNEYAAPGTLGPGLGAVFSALQPLGNNHEKFLTVYDTTCGGNGHCTGGDYDLGGPFAPGVNNTTGEGAQDPGNVLIIHEHNHECNGVTCYDPDDEGSRPAGRIFIDFTESVFLESLDFFDIESSESINSQIVLYDSNNNILNSNPTYTPYTGNNKWDRVTFNVADVSRVEVRLGGSGAIDNIRGSLQGTVPAPAPLMLMMVGLAAMLWRRQRS